MKREREQSRADAKCLQQQLSDMHDELDSTKDTEQGERETILQVRPLIRLYLLKNPKLVHLLLLLLAF